MSDWDFLHEMKDQGYSPEEIADAAAVGYAPWDELYVSRAWVEEELKEQVPTSVTSPAAKAAFASRAGAPFSVLEQAQILEDLVDCAERHLQNTGRYLQIWGELGEIYAEVRFGLRRHGSHEPGSDGTINGKLVEVKTISPEKAGDHVVVKRQGNFEQLLIVRIDEHFNFTAKLFNRDALADGGGRFLKAHLPSARDGGDSRGFICSE